MTRTYFHIAPEESAKVRDLGAVWDDGSKCWYIEDDVPRERFARWLHVAEAGDSDFTVASDEAFVAVGIMNCPHCGARVEVICIYCESGVDLQTGEALRQVTVSNIWAMDPEVERELTQWPFFREGVDGGFANHCSRCETMIEDYRLHSEPGDLFFGLRTDQEGIEFVELVGRFEAGGDLGSGFG